MDRVIVNERTVICPKYYVSILQEYNVPFTEKDDHVVVKKINYYDFVASSDCSVSLDKQLMEHVPSCLFIRMSEDAVIPSKKRASDEGYDITLIGIDKVISPVIIRYKTGIKIEPPFGYHIEMVPRSSLSSSGYMLANSIGIIDAGYTGEILVTLIKVDPDAKPVELPFKCMQALLRKSIHYTFHEVDSFDGETLRNEGGFGSTGK